MRFVLLKMVELNETILRLLGALEVRLVCNSLIFHCHALLFINVLKRCGSFPNSANSLLLPTQSGDCTIPRKA